MRHFRTGDLPLGEPRTETDPEEPGIGTEQLKETEDLQHPVQPGHSACSACVETEPAAAETAGDAPISDGEPSGLSGSAVEIRTERRAAYYPKTVVVQLPGMLGYHLH